MFTSAIIMHVQCELLTSLSANVQQGRALARLQLHGHFFT